MDLDTFLKILGERIRVIRKVKKMSQERLAELSGLHPTYISDVERGKVNASVYSYYMITNALDISFSDIINPYMAGNKEFENEITVMIELIRKLDKQEQTIVLSAIRGMITAIKP